MTEKQVFAEVYFDKEKKRLNYSILTDGTIVCSYLLIKGINEEAAKEWEAKQIKNLESFYDIYRDYPYADGYMSGYPEAFHKLCVLVRDDPPFDEYDEGIEFLVETPYERNPEIIDENGRFLVKP